MIKVETRFNFEVPNLDLKDEMKHIADRIFIPLLEEYIANEIDIDGMPYAENSESTNKTKKRKGYPLKTLTAEGLLRSAFRSKSVGDSVVINLSDRGNRREVGRILQNEGVRSKTYGRRTFKFFGISEEMNEAGIKYILRVLEERLKNA